MTYRDSDALFLPARAPQHAAPLGLPIRRSFAALPRLFSWLRRLARQVLQLFITTLAWAAGLALVIGSIVLVAAATGPRHTPLSARHAADSSPRHSLSFYDQKSRASQSVRTNSGGAGWADLNRVLVTFSGNGNRTTRHFKVTAHHAWQLQWAYRCSSQAGAAQFELLQADIGPGRATVSPTTEDFAASGRGSALLKATSHQHYLMVISACSWSVKVVQAV